MRTRLLPLATLLTPNIPEAELLLGHPIPDRAIAADRAVAELRALGAHAVLLKGGTSGRRRGRASTAIEDGDTEIEFVHDRLAVEGHGTGCTLASAIAANLCLGVPLPARMRGSDRLRVRGLALRLIVPAAATSWCWIISAPHGSSGNRKQEANKKAGECLLAGFHVWRARKDSNLRPPSS